MNDFVNAKICAGVEKKRETAKTLLGNMDAILIEMAHQVTMIADAIYRGESHVENELDNEPRAELPMVVIMQQHVDTADRLLEEIKKIREALW